MTMETPGAHEPISRNEPPVTSPVDVSRRSGLEPPSTSTEPGASHGALARTLDLLLSMGHEMGKKDPERAVECFRQAGDLAESLGLHGAECRALLLGANVELQRGRGNEAEPFLIRALALANNSADPIELASALTATAQLHQRQGRTEEALAFLRKSLAQTTESGLVGPAAEARAKTLENLGSIYSEMGDAPQSLRYFQEALELRRGLGDSACVASDLNQLGKLCYRKGRFQEAIGYFRQALEHHRTMDDPRSTAVLANNLAVTLLRQGEFQDARELFDENRQIFTELREPVRLAGVLSNLGLLESLQGHMEEAERHYLESLRLRRESQEPAQVAISLNNLSNLALERGRPEEAIRYADESLALYERSGLESGLGEPLFNKGQALLEMGRVSEALEVAERALHTATRGESDDQHACALSLLATVLLVSAEPEPAFGHATKATEHARRTGDPRLLAGCCRVLAMVRIERSELEEAKQSLTRARRLLRGPEQSYEKARILMEEGRLFARAGSIEAAAERLRRAEQAFAQIGNARWRLRALLELARLVEETDPAQSERTFAALRELAKDEELVSFLDEQLVAKPDRPADDSSGAPASAALDELVRCLLSAALQENGGSVSAYLDPFFHYLRREVRVGRAVLRVNGSNIRRWLRAGLEHSSTLYRVERLGTDSSTEIPDHVTAVKITPPVPAGASEHELRFVLVPRLIDQHESAAPQLTLELGDAHSPLGSLVLERRGQVALSDDETRAIVLAGRVLALALEGHFERAERAGIVALEADEIARFELLVGSSQKMRDVYRLIAQVAPSNTSILILGESGTGKELAARSIHALSSRCRAPFVAISCPSIPKELIESELFGHEKGAFTGAITARPGRVELAEGGTLFLDEVGDIGLSTQAKLLRFLQEREIERVGGRKALRVDVRLIAATSRDLGRAMEDGEFREDLFYRLSVVPIKMPSLRERREDLPHLADHFLRGRAGPGIAPKRISAAALDLLMSHDWPGNVRELRNAIEYMTVVCEGDIIDPRHLPHALRGDRGADRRSAAGSGFESLPSDVRPGETLESRLTEMQAALIRATLEAEGWNQSAAARRLGITESKIRNRMRQYGIQKQRGA